MVNEEKRQVNQMSMTITFELLPNEIFFQCFGYLHFSDVFYSFERLNSRFNQLIKNVHFHLDFQHVKKSVFDQISRKFLSNPYIKRQIFSLKLSNESDTCGQIKTFLNRFSLAEFPALQSLTLINIKQNELVDIQSTFSSLWNLQSIYLRYAGEINSQWLNTLPKLNNVKISLQQLYIDWSLIQGILPITHLTMSYSYSLRDFNRLFQIAPYLKSLRIENVYDDKTNVDGRTMSSLKKLVLRIHEISFDRLSIVLKQMPQLEIFTMHSSMNTELIDGNRWERLISSSLVHLTQFRFLLQFPLRTSTDPSTTSAQISDKFQSFQNDFWHRNHRWFTAYESTQCLGVIYTIPYFNHTYKLTKSTKRYSKDSLNQITNLILTDGILPQTSPMYFSNVKTLTLLSSSRSAEDTRDIQSLQTMINFSNLSHLDLGMMSNPEISFILLKIFPHAPHLSSLKIDIELLMSIIYGQLAKYFYQQIRSLHVTKFISQQQITTKMIGDFSRVFIHIQQLLFPIQRSKHCKQLVTQLTNLSNLTVQGSCFSPEENLLLKQIVNHFHPSSSFEFDQCDNDVSRPLLHIWIGKHIN